MKTAFFVLGMHRSGTSALSGTLNLLGLEFGSDLMKANPGNPKGYYENNFVYRLNEKILRENSSRWDDYRFDISVIDKTKKELYVEEAKKIIEEEFRYATNFVIKDPRICLLFPLWEEACHELDIQIKTILPYRNPIEVAASLKKRNNFSYEKSLILWSKHFLSAEYLSRNYQRIFTSFDELIDDTQHTVKILQDFIGLDIPKKAIDKIQNDFLDAAVKHNNISIANFTQDTPLFLQKILQVIKDKKFEEQTLDEIRKDFLFSLDFFQHKELFDTIEQLRFEKELLAQNRDIAYFDAEYYLAKNDDIRAAGLNPLEHFMEYGKVEGRHPNAYCAHYQINAKEIVSASELNYKQNKELKQKSALIQELQDEVERRGHWGLDLQAQLDASNATVAQKQQELEQEKEKLNAELLTLNTEYLALSTEHSKLNTEHLALSTEHSKLNTEHLALSTEHSKLNAEHLALQTQRAEIEKSYAQKLQEIEDLNTNIDEIANDLENVKEMLNNDVEQKTQELEKLNSEHSKLNTEYLALSTEHSKLNTEHLALSTEHSKLNTEYLALSTEHSKLNAEHLALQTQRAEIEKSYAQKLQEIEDLNTNIDLIVNDLASIKESKCWIYTKPIRDLQKVMKK